jgi:hypothetical protein
MDQPRTAMKTFFSVPDRGPETSASGWALPLIAAVMVLVFGVAMVATECRVAADSAVQHHSARSE